MRASPKSLQNFFLKYQKNEMLSLERNPGLSPSSCASGMAIKGKDKGEAINEEAPVDVKSLVP